jgi:hypothetical protein
MIYHNGVYITILKIMKIKRAKNGQGEKECNNENETERKKNQIKIKFTIIEPKS